MTITVQNYMGKFSNMFPKINGMIRIHINLPYIYVVFEELGIAIAHYNSKVHLSNSKKN
jgi:hypothetical protein